MADLESLGLDAPEDGGDYDTWGLENNEILKRLSQGQGSQLVITADYGEAVLTNSQHSVLVLKPTAALAGALTIKVRDNQPRIWLVRNATSGDYPVGVQCAAGGDIAYVDQGKMSFVLSDGTNCVALDSASISGLNKPSGASATTRSIRQTSTSGPLVLADAGGVVQSIGNAAVIIQIPSNATVPFPIGTQIDLGQEGDGELSIDPAGGVTINSNGGKRTIADKLLAATLLKTAADTWTLYGSLVA